MDNWGHNTYKSSYIPCRRCLMNMTSCKLLQSGPLPVTSRLHEQTNLEVLAHVETLTKIWSTMSCVQSSQCQAIPFTRKFGVMLLCLYFKLGFAQIKLTKNVEQNWWRKQFEGKEDRSNEARIFLHAFVCIAGKGLGGGIVLTNAYQKSCRNCWKVFCLIHTWWPSAFLGSVFFLGGGWGVQSKHL